MLGQLMSTVIYVTNKSAAHIWTALLLNKHVYFSYKNSFRVLKEFLYEKYLVSFTKSYRF